MRSEPDISIVTYEFVLSNDRMESTFLVRDSTRSPITVHGGTDKILFLLVFEWKEMRKAILLVLIGKLILSHTTFLGVLLSCLEANYS